VCSTQQGIGVVGIGHKEVGCGHFGELGEGDATELG